MMKKLILILMLLLPVSLAAQVHVSRIRPEPVDEFFYRYTGTEGYTTMDLSGDMSDLPAGYQKQMEPYAKMLLQGVNRMRIVVADNYSPALMLDARKLAEKLKLEQRSSTKSGDNEAFVFYRRASDKQPAECILGVMSGSSRVVIYMMGDFDITSVRSK